MTDPDWLDMCDKCRHPTWEHDILDGCRVRDDFGNRCACGRKP